MDGSLLGHAEQLRLDPAALLLPFLARFCGHVLFFQHTEVLDTRGLAQLTPRRCRSSGSER